MTVRLNRMGYEHAQLLIKSGYRVIDGRGDWSEDQPSPAEEDECIREHDFREYSRWHLGVNDDKGEDTKGRHEFPYGDFRDVHRCAVLAAQSRAGQYSHHDVELAVAHLLGMLEGQRLSIPAHRKSPSGAPPLGLPAFWSGVVGKSLPEIHSRIRGGNSRRPARPTAQYDRAQAISGPPYPRAGGAAPTSFSWPHLCS